MNAPLWFSNLVFWGAQAALLIAIACHEVIHVRRCDWAQHLAEEVIRTCLWFHPAIAWLIARVRLAREVVVLTNVRKTYLKALLEFTASPCLHRSRPPRRFFWQSVSSQAHGAVAQGGSYVYV